MGGKLVTAWLLPVAIIFLLVDATVGANLNKKGVIQETFTNPIYDGDSADPCIILIGDSYYLTFTSPSWDRITIHKSPVMTDFRNRTSKTVFAAKTGYTHVWAPEFHILDGELYIYFTMLPPGDNHRLYVMKAENASDPLGNWTSPVLLSPEDGADATILKHGNGKTYFVWSSYFILRIAEMTSPYSVSTNIVSLRKPESAWECAGSCIDEGPFFIYNKNVSYMVFSGGSTWGPDYALGLMSIDYDKDPMNASNWWYGPDGPVFWKNEEESVYTTGHAAFTTSPDGTETWMVYHGTVNGYGDRIARLEKIDWNDDGTPRFPRPHGFGSPLDVPHGQGAIKQTFNNPIFDGDSADPCIIRIGDYYYLIFSGWFHITVHQSPVMTDFRNRPSKTIFTAPPGYVQVWAPEFHILDGDLYIYFTMAKEGSPNVMYVMKAENASDPMGNWSEPIRLSPDDAIDGTILKHGNGKQYFVWSINGCGSLWIAEMTSPYNVSTNIVQLRVPQSAWECSGFCCSEGPFFLYNKNVSYMVFSGGSTWGPDYALGLMSIDYDKDPMNASNWWYGPDGPVFWKNEEESVYTTGHAAFTTSPDGTQTWMVYHGTVNGFGERIARLEKIDWNDDGTPRFPRPHGFGSALEVPHGQ